MWGMTRKRSVVEIVAQPPGYNFVHAPEVLIHKHTGYQIERADLEMSKPGRDVLRAAHELTSVEYLLHQARQELLRLGEKIRLNVECYPGDEVEPFFPGGEVNSSKIGQIDVLLERREQCIKTLRGEVAGLFHQLPSLKTKVEESMQQQGQAAA